jgi:hypothetical protein
VFYENVILSRRPLVWNPCASQQALPQSVHAYDRLIIKSASMLISIQYSLSSTISSKQTSMIKLNSLWGYRFAFIPDVEIVRLTRLTFDGSRTLPRRGRESQPIHVNATFNACQILCEVFNSWSDVRTRTHIYRCYHRFILPSSNCERKFSIKQETNEYQTVSRWMWIEFLSKFLLTFKSWLWTLSSEQFGHFCRFPWF